MQNAEQASSLAENKMGTMPIGRLLASMAIPMMISMMVQAFYNVVDSVFVARVSENALNAVSLAFPLQNLTIAVGIGTAVGMNAMLSRSLGEKNQEMVDKAANTGIFLSLCSFVIFAVIGLTLSRAFFLAQTDVMEIVDYGTDYATICLACSLGLFCQLCFERLLQSTGRTGLAMVTQLVGAVINIIINICHNHEVHIRLKISFHCDAVHQLGDDLRHQPDPHRLLHHGHGCVRRVLQAPELRLHAGLRPQQCHGAHHLL